jgi:hypothetical protein
VVGIAGFVALAFCFDGNVLTRFQIMNSARAADNSIGALQRGNHPSLGDEGAMPELDGATGWLNSDPLSRKSLHNSSGKKV